MTKPQKKLLLNLTFGFGVLAGFILSMFMFISSGDLKAYNRLTDGAGKTVQVTSEGGALSTRSGRRSKTVQYCTSWRYELDGNERHFTDKNDCYFNQAEAKSGTSAELVYDPSDLNTMFIHGDETLNSLKKSQTVFRILSLVGIVVLIGSILGLIAANRPKRKTAV